MQKNTTLKPYTPVIQTYLRQLTPPAKNKGIRYSLAQGPSQVATASTIKEAITFNLDTLNSTHKCNAHPCMHFVRRLPAQALARA